VNLNIREKRMKVQAPAEGILKNGDWGDTKMYKIVCGCSDPDHAHDVWVEVQHTDINVVIYTTNTTPFWSKNRWRQAWELFTQGFVKQEVGIVLNEQQALNYAETLKSAIQDVKNFKKS
jgi:hypothetical protein